MSSVDTNPYRTWGMTAADAPAAERASFIRQTYLHLGIAVLSFIGLEWALLNSPLALPMTELMAGSQYGWLIVLGAFMAVSWIADKWASSATNIGLQYLGLALYVIGQAVIFVPLLYFVMIQYPSDLIPTAAILTAIIFCGLTAIVFITGADFSFMRTGLMVAGFAAMGIIVCSILFGFELGIVFVGLMILFASAYILYDTSNVLHHYRIGQHVAAALALFASVALLFWYIVRLLMVLSNRD